MTNKMLPIHKVIENLRKRIAEMPLGDPNFADARATCRGVGTNTSIVSTSALTVSTIAQA